MSKFKPTGGTVSAGGDEIITTKKRRGRSLPAPQTTVVDVSSPAIAAPAPQASDELSERELNPARQFAFKCTLLFLFLRFSFFHEFATSISGVDTHLLVILGVVCYLAWFVAGGMFAAFSERLSWIWIAFVACLCLATATSTWKGGSIAIILPYIRTALPLLVLIPAVTTTPRDLTKIMNWMGLAGIATTIFGLVHRSYEEGRMDIGSEGSSIQDPNDFAAHMILLLPAIAFVTFAKGRSIFVKCFGAFIIAAALAEIMSTGSRGGFVTLIATVICIALIGSGKIRAAIFLGAPILVIIALPFVPQQASKRLRSLFDSSVSSETAAASSEARRALLMASLAVTAEHPILGVGPGVFMDYQAGMAAEQHQKGMWHETHNGYTQISSESGVPALILYLTAVVMTVKSLRNGSKNPNPELAAVSRTLLIMVLAFSTSLLFLAQGYRFTMLVLVSITVALNRVILFYRNRAMA